MSKLLAAVLALLVAAVVPAQQPVPPQPIQPGQPVPVPNWMTDRALAPVPTDSLLFVSVKAGKLWDHPAAKPVRDWVAAQKQGPFDPLVGLQPADLDRVTLFMPVSPEDGGEPLALLTTRKPYNEAVVLKALGVGGDGGDRPARARMTGRAFEIDGAFRWVAFLDDRTVLYLPRRLGDKEVGADLIARLIVRRPDGPLAAALATAPAHDLTVGFDVRGLADVFTAGPAGEVPRKLAPYLVLLKAKTATFTADFDKTARMTLTMEFPDADTAKRAAPVLEEGMKELADVLAKKDDRPHVAAVETLAAGWGVSVLKAARATAAGNLVVATADVPYQDDLAKFVAVLPKQLEVARNNTRAINNLKQLGIGLHSYHDANNLFPGDVFGNQPKAPAWSWRVQILPFIEQDNLYKQLDFMKPWDDPANLKILEAAEMPKVFELPGRPAPKGHTYFRVFSYPKGDRGTHVPFFEEGRRGPRITDIADGTSNTFMVVEAGEAVPWYKPDVLAYDGKLPLPQLGAKDVDLFLALMADGSVRTLRPKKLGDQTLRAFITSAGGEVIAEPDR